MFAFPKQAEVNRVVTKTKIYAHAKPSKRVRELFAAQVVEIVWKYKLSPETLTLPVRHGITEIQVFDLTLKTPDLADTVLHTLDKAIPFPLLFRCAHNGQVCFAASWKRPSAADASKWVVEATFRTSWQSPSSALPPLPVALDLAGLYEQLIRGHIPLPPREGESLAAHVTRFQGIQAAERERRRLAACLAREKQFNRKVELNAALRCVIADLKRALS